MDWRWKGRIARLVASLPMSNSLYYRMQRSLGSLRPNRYNPSERLLAAAKMVCWLEELGHKVDGKTFLEIGAGRTIDIPLALWLCGAKSVVTIDLNTYLVEKLIRESISFLCRRYDEIVGTFGCLANRLVFKERLDMLRQFDGRLADLLHMTNIEYLAPADGTRLSVPDKSIDFHFSYTVLEHIPADILPPLLKEAQRVLTPGGLLLHIIDPSDHFSHDDGSITAVNFLQFSDHDWSRLADNKFSYHNRLRAYEYDELFTRAGIRLVGRREAIDERSLAALRDGFKVDERFRHITPERLAVRSIILMGDFEKPVNQLSLLDLQMLAGEAAELPASLPVA